MTRKLRDLCGSSHSSYFLISHYQYGGQTDSQNKCIDTCLFSSAFLKYVHLEPWDPFWLVMSHSNNMCHACSDGLRSHQWRTEKPPVMASHSLPAMVTKNVCAVDGTESPSIWVPEWARGAKPSPGPQHTSHKPKVKLIVVFSLKPLRCWSCHTSM